MAIENWTSRWWETSVVVLAVNSVVFGVLFIYNDYPLWGIAVGFAPAILLITGLAIRRRQRVLATVILTVAGIGAAFAWWTIYPVVLAIIVVLGGFMTGKIGPQASLPEVA